jgi:hypothetical protein
VTLVQQPQTTTTRPILNSYTFPDVTAVLGLPVDALLASGALNQPRHGRMNFAFARNWDGDTVLSELVGQSLTASALTDAVVQSNTSTANELALGNPLFTEWSILADQGVFAVEVSQFRYANREVVSVLVEKLAQ